MLNYAVEVPKVDFNEVDAYYFANSKLVLIKYLENLFTCNILYIKKNRRV